jgi:hypothetical protein
MKPKLRVSLQEILYSHHYNESSYVKIVKSSLPTEMHYNCTFSKKAYDFEF